MKYKTFDFQEVKTVEKILIDKDYILTNYSEAEIYTYYLGYQISTKKPFHSPFKKEKTPSFRFFQSGNKLKFKCFSSGYSGDVFDLVKYLYGVDSLYEICKLINDDLSINLSAVRNTIKLNPVQVANKDISTVIDVELRDFRQSDYDYWNKYYIGKDLLDKYNIKPCSKVWIGDDYLWYKDTLNNPCYRYRFNGKIKCYKPLNGKKDRFVTNCNNLKNVQGIDQCVNKKGDIGIITSSYKDVIVVNEYWDIPSIAPQGESHIINEKVITWFKSKFKRVVIFYNNDSAGIEAAANQSKIYDCEFIVCNESKDPSDYIKEFGIDKFKQLKNELL